MVGRAVAGQGLARQQALHGHDIKHALYLQQCVGSASSKDRYPQRRDGRDAAKTCVFQQRSVTSPHPVPAACSYLPASIAGSWFPQPTETAASRTTNSSITKLLLPRSPLLLPQPPPPPSWMRPSDGQAPCATRTPVG
jgi:hypothetical protein